jgi:phosphatidylserine decarboxylase
MTVRTAIARLAALEELNFLLTNRIPRRLATRLVGWLSRIEHPMVARPTIFLWRLFCDVDLAGADTSRFASMRACFTRRLLPGARRFDPDPAVMTSPCDAILGAHGVVEQGNAYQIKGAPYRLGELIGDDAEAAGFEGGLYATLRLTAGMYHHFHAPCDLTVERAGFIAGDCWNVNTPALKRVERLFCRNARAALRCRTAEGVPFLIVAVAAILVSDIRLAFDAAERVVLRKGDEMGWFEQGSTILLFLPSGLAFTPGWAAGDRLRAGDALLRAPHAL